MTPTLGYNPLPGPLGARPQLPARVDAIVVGAGPNGLVAANRLADAGWSVVVLEAEPVPGGAVKSAELIEPGFVNDLFSAFYPLAAFSPVIAGLELERYGLHWRHGPLVLAHPSTEGPCVALSRSIDETAVILDRFAVGDGDAWRSLLSLWRRLEHPAQDMLTAPIPPLRALLRLATAVRPNELPQLVRETLLPVRRFVDEHFQGIGAKRLIAGNALHADLTPETAIGGFFGFVLTALGQTVGFPFPEGGAGRLSAALVARLEARSGQVICNCRVEQIIIRNRRAVGVRTADGSELGVRHAVLAACDAPTLYLRLLPRDVLPARILAGIERFHWDWSTIKLDWTLDGRVPWEDCEARRAPVVHVTDSIDAMTRQTSELAMGLIPRAPFLVFGHYSIGDPTRAPAGKETAWAYTHLPQQPIGDAADELSGSWKNGELARFVERMEEQVERLAPGFRRLIRGRHVFGPRELEAADTNLAGGAINGGTAQLHQQLIFRPVPGLGRPETPIENLYLASASAHPGGAVHGSPGAIAARAAINRRRARRSVYAFAGAAIALAAASRART